MEPINSSPLWLCYVCPIYYKCVTTSYHQPSPLLTLETKLWENRGLSMSVDHECQKRGKKHSPKKLEMFATRRSFLTTYS